MAATGAVKRLDWNHQEFKVQAYRDVKHVNQGLVPRFTTTIVIGYLLAIICVDIIVIFKQSIIFNPTSTRVVLQSSYSQK